MIYNSNGKTIDLSEPKVMGILNLTSDSFYDGGRYLKQENAISLVEKMVSEGVDILDMGAASSRPGAKEIPAEDELKILIPVLKEVLSKFPDLLISIDTFRGIVADECIKEGASLINDISGFNLDEKMLDVISRHDVPYVLMHMQGIPGTMQKDPRYSDVVGEILSFLIEKIRILRKNNVNQIIVDPGFGFGKTIKGNYTLLNNLNVFKLTGFPVLAGISRKSMIYKLLDIEPDETLGATMALQLKALEKGAKLLRVHDVKEAKQVIKLYNALNSDIVVRDIGG